MMALDGSHGPTANVPEPLVDPPLGWVGTGADSSVEVVVGMTGEAVIVVETVMRVV